MTHPPRSRSDQFHPRRRRQPPRGGPQRAGLVHCGRFRWRRNRNAASRRCGNARSGRRRQARVWGRDRAEQRERQTNGCPSIYNGLQRGPRHGAGTWPAPTSPCPRPPEGRSARGTGSSQGACGTPAVVSRRGVAEILTRRGDTRQTTPADRPRRKLGDETERINGGTARAVRRALDGPAPAGEAGALGRG